MEGIEREELEADAVAVVDIVRAQHPRGRGDRRRLRNGRDQVRLVAGGCDRRAQYSRRHGSVAAVARQWRVRLAVLYYSILTSMPQPIVAVPAFLLVSVFQPLLPASLGFRRRCNDLPGRPGVVAGELRALDSYRGSVGRHDRSRRHARVYRGHRAVGQAGRFDRGFSPTTCEKVRTAPRSLFPEHSKLHNPAQQSLIGTARTLPIHEACMVALSL